MKPKQEKNTPTKIATEERLRLLANILIDRILEDKQSGIINLMRNSITLDVNGELKKINEN